MLEENDGFMLTPAIFNGIGWFKAAEAFKVKQILPNLVVNSFELSKRHRASHNCLTSCFFPG